MQVSVDYRGVYLHFIFMIKHLLSSFLLLGLLFSIPVFAQTTEQFDLVITNARIIDGAGNPWFRGAIGVRSGKIVKVGRVGTTGAKQTIDAQNRIVAPGFIDVHAHVEGIYNNPNAENFVRMGVTSLITGNCGGSAVDVKKFLGRVNETPIAVNLATLIAHGSVRAKVMGLDDRAPTAEEQAAMDALVEQAMRDGAVGLSTGLIYVPGTFAKTGEIVELAKIAARHGGIYATHMRDEDTHVLEAIKESIEIGELANIPVEISHFKIASKRLWGASDKTINLVKAARDRGLQISVDQYAYAASSTSLESRLPAWAIAGGLDEAKKRLADKPTRAKIVAEMKLDLKEKDFKDYGFAYVVDYDAKPDFNGKNIAEITELTKKSKKLDAQIEQIFEMYEAGGAGMVYRVMSEEDVQNILRQPFTMIGSDSSVRRFNEGFPHPRGYGNNARILGKYVREMKIITLEDAIRKMTSLPAQTFGLRDRGLIKEGFAADLVIFDENKIADKATFEQPHQYAEGFAAVIVNGEIVFDGEKLTGKMAGQALVKISE